MYVDHLLLFQTPAKKTAKEIQEEEEEELQLALALSLSQEEAAKDVCLLHCTCYYNPSLLTMIYFGQAEMYVIPVVRVVHLLMDVQG